MSKYDYLNLEDNGLKQYKLLQKYLPRGFFKNLNNRALFL